MQVRLLKINYEVNDKFRLEIKLKSECPLTSSKGWHMMKIKFFSVFV